MASSGQPEAGARPTAELVDALGPSLATTIKSRNGAGINTAADATGGRPVDVPAQPLGETGPKRSRVAAKAVVRQQERGGCHCHLSVLSPTQACEGVRPRRERDADSLARDRDDGDDGLRTPGRGTTRGDLPRTLTTFRKWQFSLAPDTR